MHAANAAYAHLGAAKVNSGDIVHTPTYATAQKNVPMSVIAFGAIHNGHHSRTK
jgi:hypothetical protein